MNMHTFIRINVVVVWCVSTSKTEDGIDCGLIATASCGAKAHEANKSVETRPRVGAQRKRFNMSNTHTHFLRKRRFAGR